MSGGIDGFRVERFSGTTTRAVFEAIEARFGGDAEVLEFGSEEGRVVALAAAAGNRAAAQDAELVVTEVLRGNGVPAQLARELSSRARRYGVEGAAVALACALEEALRFDLLPDLGDWESPVMVVGEPGAGKTLSCARLALAAGLRGAPVTLLTLDCGKSGGLAQLDDLGAWAGAEVRPVPYPEMLASTVNGVPAGRAVVIDTTGFNALDAARIAETRALAEAVGARVLVVHPAWGCADEQAGKLAGFRELSPVGMLVSKLDIVRRLGGLVGGSAASGLPILAGSASPYLGVSTERLTSVDLARRMMGVLECDRAPADGLMPELAA